MDWLLRAWGHSRDRCGAAPELAQLDEEGALLTAPRRGPCLGSPLLAPSPSVLSPALLLEATGWVRALAQTLASLGSLAPHNCCLGARAPLGLSSGPDQCWWLLQQQPAHVCLDPQKALPSALAFWERRERQSPGAHCRGQSEGAGAHSRVSLGRQNAGTQSQWGPGTPSLRPWQVPWGTVAGPGGPRQGSPGVMSARCWSWRQMGLPLSSPQVPLPGSGEHLASEVLGPCGVGMCYQAGLCPHTQALRHRPMLWQGGSRGRPSCLQLQEDAQRG